MFISQAWAQSDEVISQSSQFSFSSFVPLLLIFIIFYFLIIRPQTKKIKEHQRLLNELKIGYKIVTSSGIYGNIKNIDNKSNIIDLEIADNIVIKINKSSINELVVDKNKTNQVNKTNKANKKNSK